MLQASAIPALAFTVGIVAAKTDPLHVHPSDTNTQVGLLKGEEGLPSIGSQGLCVELSTLSSQ